MRNKKFMLTLATILCFSLLFLLNGCGQSSGGAEETSDKKDTLVVVIADDMGSFDPQDNSSFAHHQVTRQIYETLVVRDENFELKPWLAEAWKWEDDITLMLYLRPGVYFSNGEELKAGDVLFTIKHSVLDNTIAAMQFSHIDLDKTEIIDDYTLKVVLKEPFPTQLEMFEHPFSCIVNEKAYTENGGNYGTPETAVGTGPYVAVEYNIGDSVVLKANPNYWIEDQPYIKNIIFRAITDSSSRAIEAETGGADIVYDIGFNDIDRIKNSGNVEYINAVGLNTAYVCFNTSMKPLDDIRVRQAIWYAIDRAAAVKAAYGSFGSVATGLFSPGLDGRHEDLSSYFVKRDVEKGKQLLAEAGYPDGFDLRISCENSVQMRMDFSEIIQAQLAEVGINLILDFQTDTAYEEEGLNRQHMLTIYGFTASTGEVGRNIMRWLPEYSESAFFGNWENEEFISLIRKAMATVDEQERYAMFARGQELIMESFCAMPIWTKELNAAIQPDVKGFYIMPTYEQNYLQQVYFEE